jgi:hypothetical protein
MVVVALIPLAVIRQSSAPSSSRSLISAVRVVGLP